MAGQKPTAELIAEVERLLREGGTASSIGAAVGRSRGSIVGLVHRHLAHVGFKHTAPWRMMRLGAIRKMLDTKRARLAERAKMKPDDFTVVDKIPPLDKPINRPSPPPPPIEVPLQDDGRIRVMDLKEHHCRWPMWCDEVTNVDDKHFCGAMVARGRYCAEHGRRMYAVPRR